MITQADSLGSWLIGTACRRKPHGRSCKVLDITEAKVKVQDHSWVGWINRSTFIKEWSFQAPPKSVQEPLEIKDQAETLTRAITASGINCLAPSAAAEIERIAGGIILALEGRVAKLEALALECLRRGVLPIPLMDRIVAATTKSKKD